MKLSRAKIRNLIIKEFQSMGEDVIVPRAVASSQDTPPLSAALKCEQCGSTMNEDECMECGYVAQSKIFEGSGCGCGTCEKCNSKFNNSNNNYMAKASLYKVSKYAQKLLNMIPDGYELDDWQRTKIAQLADDISEVYHALDYDEHEGEI
tara:strand:+ start:280 stop:729 length:450 start_codon:yes stop_codon:yes gene_type:complete